MYLKVQGIQKVPKGPRNPKGTYRSKVSKMYLKVQGIKKVPKVPRYPKGTSRSKVSKSYLKVQASGGGDRHTNPQTHKQTHQYHESAWPRGLAE